MAVYTHLSHPQLVALLARYPLGTPSHSREIAGGIENSNYFVDFSDRDTTTRTVFTIFEEFSHDEMPFFLAALEHLEKATLPIPIPFIDTHGKHLLSVEGKPALLQPCMRGEAIPKELLKPIHCHEIGAFLARFHLAGATFASRRTPHRGRDWWRRYAPLVMEDLDIADRTLLADAIEEYDRRILPATDLPRGLTHGDLFHDNALFVGDELSAVIDLFNCATDFFLFDVAVVANDWCVYPSDTPREEHVRALLTGYTAIRPFTVTEEALWPTMLRVAAMRFWLSRLLPALGIAQNPSSCRRIVVKDPSEFRTILHARQ